MGFDDVVSIVAPLLVTYALDKKMYPILFLYVNAVSLFVIALLAFKIKAQSLNEDVTPKSIKNLFVETFQNYSLLKSLIYYMLQ